MGGVGGWGGYGQLCCPASPKLLLGLDLGLGCDNNVNADLFQTMDPLQVLLVDLRTKQIMSYNLPVT